MASIAFKNIAKSYGPTPVIRDVSLDVRDGEFMVFVGPSGCGKSTMLRMVAGLESITAGDLLIDGQRSMNAARPNVGPPWCFKAMPCTRT